MDYPSRMNVFEDVELKRLVNRYNISVNENAPFGRRLQPSYA